MNFQVAIHLEFMSILEFVVSHQVLGVRFYSYTLQNTTRTLGRLGVLFDV
jgi:hypothetical protein